MSPSLCSLWQSSLISHRSLHFHKFQSTLRSGFTPFIKITYHLHYIPIVGLTEPLSCFIPLSSGSWVLQLQPNGQPHVFSCFTTTPYLSLRCSSSSHPIPICPAKRFHFRNMTDFNPQTNNFPPKIAKCLFSQSALGSSSLVLSCHIDLSFHMRYLYWLNPLKMSCRMQSGMTSAPTFERSLLWVFPIQVDINYCSPSYTCALGMHLTPHII